MPRRHATNAQDALELFLDTISNTFGGVVFIALLVAILIQVTDKQQREADPLAKRRELQTQLAASTTEITRLEQILAQLERLEQSGGTSDNAERQTTLAVIDAELSELEDLQAELDRELSARQQVLAKREAELAGCAGNNQRCSTELDDLKLRLEQVQNQDPQQVRLPRFQSVDKRQIAVLISAGRLVFFFTEDQDGRYGKVNVRDLDIQPGGQEYLPRPGQGILIGDNDEFRRALRRALSRFNRDQDYVYAVVWPDSYSEFAILRDTLLEMQYGYGLVLMEDGEAVRLGSGSGAGEQ
jgi:hypothetical protein